MGNNDCFVVMSCFWEVSFIPGWIVLCLVLIFFFTWTHSLQDVSTAEHDLHYTPFQQSDQCMQTSAHAVSRWLQRSQAKWIQLQDWDLNCELQHPCTKLGLGVCKAMQMKPAFAFWVCWFYMFSNPSFFFFFPYLIFYIKSRRFLSASVWPPNPINIRIFFPHLQNKQTIRRPASPQLFLTF